MCESPIDRLELGEADTILDYRHFSWSSPQILSIGPAMLTGATLVLAGSSRRRGSSTGCATIA